MEADERGGPAVTNGGERKRLAVNVVSPDQVGYRGEARSLIAPAYDGKVGILYGHAPMTVLLGTGELLIRSDEGTLRMHVSRGFLQVVDNEVSVLAEDVEV